MQTDGENMWMGELVIVNPPPASGLIGTIISYVPVVLHAVGATVFEIVGGVPLGLTLNPSTGSLTGTLTINLGGPIRIKVTDSIGRTYTTP